MARIPAGTVDIGGKAYYLPEFYLDRHEVTNEEFSNFLEETHSRPEGQWGQYAGMGRERWPACHLTFQDATAYARFSHKRLPTAYEWLRAYGGSRYPWGNEWVEGNANVNTRSVAPVGSFPKDRTPYGVYDMAGNLFEWTATSVPPDQRVVCGGAWVYQEEAAQRGQYVLFDANRSSFAIGFRCAWP